jgi:DNA-binding response OmpR family regulator
MSMVAAYFNPAFISLRGLTPYFGHYYVRHIGMSLCPSAMSKTRILLAEDEPRVATILIRGLEDNGYEVKHASNGQEALQEFRKAAYDLIVLDVRMPYLSGVEVCQHIREVQPLVPILLLTALDSTEDKVKGLDSGADDYLAKPFEFRELLARLRALQRRNHERQTEEPIITIADLTVNRENKSVSRAGQAIELTAREFDLLVFFMSHYGKVLSRAEIARNVWDVNFDTGTNVIDVYVNFLRKKIDRDFTPKLIHTRIGMGYCLKVETEVAA